jgi:hypothetical protein
LARESGNVPRAADHGSVAGSNSSAGLEEQANAFRNAETLPYHDMLDGELVESALAEGEARVSVPDLDADGDRRQRQCVFLQPCGRPGWDTTQAYSVREATRSAVNAERMARPLIKRRRSS